MLLEGKVAVITGAGSGLGLATARLFTEHGARVVAVDMVDDAGKQAAEAIRGDGGKCEFFHADVTSGHDMEAAVAFAEATFGHLDIMVANAGILGRATFRRTEEITDEDWDEVIRVNLGGTFRSFRAAIPALRRAGGGALTATSSVAASFASLYLAAYSSSKGGINALVRALSVELAPDKIRVNAVCPGVMATNLGGSLGRARDALEVELPDRNLKARMLPVDRDATSEAARVHLFLCSELAAFVNGEAVTADGGFSIWNGV
jgi:NAD(P)-dependent dehydrogenase (short-subunit alcohol dehydrogenase family)